MVVELVFERIFALYQTGYTNVCIGIVAKMVFMKLSTESFAEKCGISTN